MSKKSKNWNDKLLSDVYSIRQFQRKDKGITIQYFLIHTGITHIEWMSERFEIGEQIIIRVNPSQAKISMEGNRK